MAFSRLAFLLPGQGSQFVGMGRALAEAYPAVLDLYDRADGVLGTDLSRICWEGPEEELTQTQNAQPSILLHSYAVCTLDGLGLSNEETILPVVPMFHVNAWGIPYASAMCGAKMVMPGSQHFLLILAVWVGVIAVLILVVSVGVAVAVGDGIGERIGAVEVAGRRVGKGPVTVVADRTVGSLRERLDAQGVAVRVGGAFGAELAQGLEQNFHLLRRQHAGRFIHY